MVKPLPVEQPMPVMIPASGERLVRFVGDTVRFQIRDGAQSGSPGWQARLRTNLGRAAVVREEIIAAHAGGAMAAGESWQDLPMTKTAAGWEIELPLAETGFFKAKAYLLSPQGWQSWPEGGDIALSVHPDFARTANTIYCAFTRLFGATKSQATTQDDDLDVQLKALEARGYATLPPSGKLRDLTRQLPHIVQRLGCRIIHLLPIHPTPVTYARFGRMGSPYAALDLTAIDPALVEFDKRTTGVDQFIELTDAAHSLGARVFIDIVINHTGWGSTLQETHPEFFLKLPNGEFASPGAWGTVWEDLIELEQNEVALWDIIAEALLVCCQRGVDGFRCDAGYKVPVPAWQYIIARVRAEFPDAIFLLEGLGGPWEITESLLTDGGMQWAYSELFQNYSGRQVANYLDYANRQSERVGLYIHYSETHDNSRLAERGRPWSLLRNRLCALTSICGGFGFTCGVEWLATEKIRVHGNTGLNWDSADNIVHELTQLNQLVTDHPCFFDGAKLTRLSPPDSSIYALLRESAEGLDTALVLVNTDVKAAQVLVLTTTELPVALGTFNFDLLGQPLSQFFREKDQIIFTLPPGACHCLATTAKTVGLSGEAYRQARAHAAWAFSALQKVLPVEAIEIPDRRWLARQVELSPENFLAAASHLAQSQPRPPLAAALAAAEQKQFYPQVIIWSLADTRRITTVPPGHWLVISGPSRFRARLENLGQPEHVQSIAAGGHHIACFAPRIVFGDAQLVWQCHDVVAQPVKAVIRFLTAEPAPQSLDPKDLAEDLVLLTNGIGGMARICVDLGHIRSKYDCVLGANLNPAVPVDRHVFVKRLRLWVNADGFISALDLGNLTAFAAGPPATWLFVAQAGNGRTVEIELQARMVAGQNTTAFHFRRPGELTASGKQLPPGADVRLTARFDIEDRNFHSETKRNGGSDYHFSSNVHALEQKPGFAFTPAPDRQLRIVASSGVYHQQPEWCENIPHPVEQTRGQTGSGDAYSPGWFELPLPKGAEVSLVVTAELSETRAPATEAAQLTPPMDDWGARLKQAAKAYVVRRDTGKTVIAGYPWFLDWGRDSLISARGLLASGMVAEVKQLVLTFARFEDRGTLPNTIHGNDVSNRDTSDAPLWFGMVCETLAETDPNFYRTPVNETGRTVADVLRSIAKYYLEGTPNGIHADLDSALIWSPSHFTWMDTNYPAGTPREGYPVEIQALWIRLLRQVARLSSAPDQKKWTDLAEHALASLEKLFWLEKEGWFADVLIGGSRVIARDAIVCDALRSNGLLLVSLGLVKGGRAKRCVAAAQKYLVVPGALRTLAPLPVTTPLPIYGNDGRRLNDPDNPYWPRYEGDEDTRRKPAYHNGTAWTWTFPIFCEALAVAWDFSPEAVAAAKAWLGSAEAILDAGCLGQLPEILDGDAPHTQRGCDAQAWGVTESVRVWELLRGK
jgi:starch synthase (maltosyl-transferring)